MKLPRFLRTKHGVFAFYLTILAASYLTVNGFVATSIYSRLRSCEKASRQCAEDVDTRLRAMSEIRSQIESLLAAERGGSVGGSDRSAPGPGTDSGSPEPEAAPAPLAEPQLLGIGQNGLYAYADIQFPDGHVERQYHRLPDGLRRGTRRK